MYLAMISHYLYFINHSLPHLTKAMRLYKLFYFGKPKFINTIFWVKHWPVVLEFAIYLPNRA